MENKDTPAFAINDTTWTKMGLTKREYFAGLAMQGIMSRYIIMDDGDYPFVCRQSVKLADELLKKLENK